MNWWQRLRFNRRQLPNAPQAPQEALQFGVGGKLSIAAVRGMDRALKKGTPEGRLSADSLSDSGLGLGRGWNWWNVEPTSLGYPGDSLRRLVGVLRMLAEKDEDVHGAIRDFIDIGNPGYTIEFQGGSRAVAAAAREIEAWQKSIFPVGGNLNGLINNQIRELTVSLGSSVEWFPLQNRKGVQDAVPVLAENIRAVRDKETQFWRYFQVGVQAHTLELHPMTYCYKALNVNGSSNYGTPLFISAIESLHRKHEFLLPAEKRILNLMQNGAFLLAGVPEPTPEQVGLPAHTTKTDPDYVAAVEEYFFDITQLMLAGRDNGFYLHPKGIEAKITPLAKAADGMPQLHEVTDRRVNSGIRTPGMLRGFKDTETETRARVVYPVFEQEGANLQQVVKIQIEFGLNLQLRLRGIPATAWLHLDRPKSPFAKDYADTDLVKAQVDEKMLAIVGDVWLTQVMRRWDLDPEKDIALGRELREKLDLPDPGVSKPIPEDADSGGVAEQFGGHSVFMRYDKAGDRYKQVKSLEEK